MAATILSAILGLRVKSVSWVVDEWTVWVQCDRDWRFAPVTKRGGKHRMATVQTRTLAPMMAPVRKPPVDIAALAL